MPVLRSIIEEDRYSVAQPASCEKFRKARKKLPAKNETTFLMGLARSSSQGRRCSLPHQSIIVTESSDSHIDCISGSHHDHTTN